MPKLELVEILIEEKLEMYIKTKKSQNSEEVTKHKMNKELDMIIEKVY